MSEANKRQPGGDHYLKRKIQPWDFIISNGLGFLEGNIVKYISRWKDKDSLKDLLKAQHYLEKLIETAKENSGESIQSDGDGSRL